MTLKHAAAVVLVATIGGAPVTEYFLTLAKQKEAEVKEHASMASTFRVSGQRRGSEFAAMHCDSLAKFARDAAKEATASAELHRQLANIG